MFSPPVLALIALAMLPLASGAFFSLLPGVLVSFSLGSIVLFFTCRRYKRLALYRQICRETARLYYNPSALKSDWQQSHLLRTAMRSDRDALSLAQAMLDSLQDSNTRILSKREVEIEASLDAVSDVTVKILRSAVGYLKVSRFGGAETASQALRALAEFKQTRAIVIDLRDNPGGQLRTALKLTSLFLEAGKIATIRQRLPGEPGCPTYHSMAFELSATAIELEGRATSPLSSLERHTESRLPYMAGGKQLVVLVNEASASAAELMAGALKDNRAATVIGTPTYGKGTGQSVITLKGGAQLTVTTMQYFTPNGLYPGDGNGSGPGIVPDIVVRQNDGTGEGAEEDTQLQKALNHLSSRGAFRSLPAPIAPDVSLARILSLLRR